MPPQRPPVLWTRGEHEEHAKAKRLAASVLGLATPEPVQAADLVAIVQRGQGLTDEVTWQSLAEFVARQYSTGGELLRDVIRQLSECAKMQLLIRSLRRKEGGSLENERLAAFQALMAEVYGTNGSTEEAHDDG